MRPLDPRLLRHARGTRPFVIGCAALGVLTAALVLAQADLLATAISRAFLDGAALSALAMPIVALAVIIMARAAVSWVAETAAHRASTGVLSELRAAVVRQTLATGPRRRRATHSPAELATLATRGVDRLDGYFARYLPQLLIAAIVPAMVAGRILLADATAAVLVAITVPLIPLFMILIGRYTQRDVRRQWRTLSVLGNHFLDLVAGLAVLTAFGRARAQRRTLAVITNRYRVRTMRTLRVAFLSALVLELLATLSVALVAVSVGLRLVSGGLDLHTALVVLILAPEVYLPLRAVGARFHDSAEGVAAAEEILTLLDDSPPRPAGARSPAPDPSRVPVRLRGVGVRGRAGEPVLDDLTLTVRPGEVVGVTGPSGAGKSTLLDLLLGWYAPDAGRILVDGVDLAGIDPRAWRARVAWVPQRPRLIAGTIAHNNRLGAPAAPDHAVARVALAAALDVPLETEVGELGAGLSTGQQRRVALARAVLLDRPLLLLDEPTEGVDGDTEAAILDRLPDLLAGRTAIIVTHRASVLEVCDRVVRLPSPPSGATPPSTKPPSAKPLGVEPAAAQPAAPESTLAGAADNASPSPRRLRLVIHSRPGYPQPRPTSPLPSPPTDRMAVRAAPGSGGGYPSMGGADQERGSAGWRGGTSGRGGVAGLGRGVADRAGENADPPRRGVAWGWLRAAVRPYRVRLALACMAGAAALGSGVALTATSAWLISAAALHPPVLTLMVAIVAVRTFGLAKGVLRYAERLLSHDVALRALADLRVRVWAALVRLGPAVTARLRRGDLLNRLVSDVDSQQDVLVRGLVPVVSAVAVAAGAAVGIGILLPEAGVAVAVGLIVAGGLAPALSVAAARGAEHKTALLRAEVTAGTVELLTAAPDLIAFGAARAKHAAVRQADTALTRALRASARARGAGAATATLAIGATSLAALLLGIAALRAGRLAGPELAVLALTPLAAAELVAGLPEAAARLLGAGHGSRRLADLERIPTPTTQPVAPHDISRATALATERLAVRWPGADTVAVAGLDLRIGPGRAAVLAGPSGAGKTTALAGIMRHLDPSAGRITLDAVDTRTADPDAVRARIAWCGPDTHLFDSTLRENLRLARPDATDADLTAALAAASLGAWLAGLPGGLDTALGAHGTGVSGGERQRIGIARALLANRPFLLLDEPTAHLDGHTAAGLAAELRALAAGRAALIVTHRPADFPDLPVISLARPPAGEATPAPPAPVGARP